MLTTTNDSILVNYSTFVVTTEENRAYLDTSPFGVDLRWFIDPTVTRSAVFLDLLQRLDALTFGPEGMPMDKWVFYDCAELPGFIYGFAMTVDDMTDREIELFGIPSGYGSSLEGRTAPACVRPWNCGLWWGMWLFMGSPFMSYPS